MAEDFPIIGSIGLMAPGDNRVMVASIRSFFLANSSDAGTYESLNAAINTLGSASAALIISRETVVTANLTIPANVTVVVMPGGSISQGAYTVTINGQFVAGRISVFTGSGAITFGSIKKVFPEWWGGMNYGGVDCAAALMAAGNSAAGAYGITVSLLPGAYGSRYYLVNSLVTFAQSGVKLEGSGNRSSVIKAGDASAGIKFSKGGSAIYSAMMQDVTFHGAGISTVGIEFEDSSECIMVRSGAYDCVTGIRLGGSILPSSLKMVDCICSYNTVALDLVNAADIQIIRPDLYANDTNFQFTTCWRLLIQGGWMEDWDTVFLFDHSMGNAIAYSVNVDGVYLLNTRGGASFTSRVIKSYSSNNTYQTYCPSFIMSNCHLYLDNSKYIAEVAWGSPHSYGPFDLKMENNHGMILTNTVAWFSSDVLDNPNLIVRLDNHLHPDVQTVVHTDVALNYLIINGHGERKDDNSFLRTAGSLTMDGNWHTINCSSWVPYGTTWVLLLVSIEHTAVGTYLLLRKQGNANMVDLSICRTQVIDEVIDFDVWVPVNTSAQFEYLASAAFSVCNIALKGWI